MALVVALAMFLAWSYKQDKMVRSAATKLHEHKATDMSKSPKNIGVNIDYVTLGLIGLTGGASLLIDEATGIARDFGIPESIIGLMMIALVKSLPKLFATVIATLRRHRDNAVGNVLGSNLLNILSTLGSRSAIEPLDFAEDIRTIDLSVVLGVTVVALQLMVS